MCAEPHTVSAFPPVWETIFEVLPHMSVLTIVFLLDSFPEYFTDI